ncbi:coiled-coil domain-containing protein 152 isoform X2 [Takifugu rubripes]|uniref:coiled-coil domain-containing protein 152 isoform X2 n=1 Tax=Takifugu rubripes TaxID=31033 RepID=UPI00114600C0|nr:coiled-coil domain-containing protein 152 isoform X2 [Takifugu rubripes]
MANSNCLNLDVLMEKFIHLEQKMTEVTTKNSMLEARLEDEDKLLKFYMNKEKSLVDERDGLLISLNRLQQCLQEQSHLRVENNRLKTDLADLEQQNKKREESKDAEVKKLLELKDLDLEEMKTRLKNQEKERQSELLRLQMEFGAKLARVQSSAQWSQQQLPQQWQHSPNGPGLLPHTFFKRKLHFLQEEKNREIVALRQRIKELEENQHSCRCLKRRKM